MILYLNEMLLMGHSDTTSGFCNQLAEICFETSAGDRICGAKNQLSQPTSLIEEKIQKVRTKCQNLLPEPKTSILELTKMISLLISTIQALYCQQDHNVGIFSCSKYHL